jgi:pyrroloquinoline quinone biosynthesis protein E
MVVEAPLGMIAELTHRCPLHCLYCSNPIELAARESELDTATWRAVISQARELGVLQLHLSGGEPLVRSDLAELVGHARDEGCYVNLVTSGLGLTPRRGGELAHAGVDHVQLSVQDADPRAGDAVAGVAAHRRKLAAARVVTSLGLALTVNAVLHRGNLDRIGAIIELAEGMGAQRLELANTQYYGWALRNRAVLLPTETQLAAAEVVVSQARRRLGTRMRIGYVPADYYQRYPKPCMHGWASRQLCVTPDGSVLACLAASVIPGLVVDNVAHTALREIWYHSEGFTAFRGTEWMRAPCRGCPRRELDFGGCRCQAAVLTGDPRAADPVCVLSPDRPLIDAILAAAVMPGTSAGVPRRAGTPGAIP